MELKNVLYFNTTRTNTLAILTSLNNIKHWTKDEEGNDTQGVIPIKFGNYEKAVALEDLSEDLRTTGNFNFVPRMVLSFTGMTKAPERDTNKFHKISRRFKMASGSVALQFAYNSVAYDFQYTLVLQARGLPQAYQAVEQILSRFRPSYAIAVREYPLFDKMTETQLLTQDPTFEIIEDFDEFDVNLVNVTFDLTLRGNLYMPLHVTGPIETVKLSNYLWDTYDIAESQAASYYEYDVCRFDGHIYNQSVENHIAPEKLYGIKPEEIKEPEECISPSYDTLVAIESYDELETEDTYGITTEQPRN